MLGDQCELSSSEVDHKIAKFQQKIDLEMRPQLDRVLVKRDQIYKEQADYLQLKTMIDLFKTQKLKKFTSQVDVGCDIFVKTQVEDTSKVMVALSKDFFVELSHDEALQYISKKDSYLTSKTTALTKKASEIKAHILFVQEAMRELLNITPDKIPRER